MQTDSAKNETSRDVLKNTVRRSGNSQNWQKKQVFREAPTVEFDYFSWPVYSPLQPLLFHIATNRSNRQNQNGQLVEVKLHKRATPQNF